ncbi:uncharacterized protein LOC135684000 [Rhopilema esculentum]|uniref:uncharacterized protein LOC135684000 n=1 Tax=Rhopilema esculentum TaxID=499914 RepID=UPI0031CFA640
MILKPRLFPNKCMLSVFWRQREVVSSSSCICSQFLKGRRSRNPSGFSRMTYASNSFLTLPWLQNTHDETNDDPFHHKLVGMILLRRVLKNTSREEFKLNEFIHGVKHAIKALAFSIQSEDKDETMIRMLGSNLQIKFRQAFDEMKKRKQRVILEVESLKDFRISGVRAIFGGADPGDQYVISCFGQKIIASKRDMFELEKRADLAGYSTLFDYGKKLGFSAAEKEIRFQIDVKFATSERYYIEEKRESGWHIVFGGIDIVSAAHRLRFESILEDGSETIDRYPLSWKIINIDYNETDDVYRNSES